MCDTGVFLVHTDDATHESGFVPATQLLTPEEYREGYSPDSPQGSVFLDILTKRGVKVNDGLSVIIMNYMDAWSMDVQPFARVLDDGDRSRRPRHPVLLVPSDRRRWSSRLSALVQGRAALIVRARSGRGGAPCSNRS